MLHYSLDFLLASHIGLYLGFLEGKHLLLKVFNDFKILVSHQLATGFPNLNLAVEIVGKGVDRANRNVVSL